MNRFCPSMKS